MKAVFVLFNKNCRQELPSFQKDFISLWTAIYWFVSEKSALNSFKKQSNQNKLLKSLTLTSDDDMVLDLSVQTNKTNHNVKLFQ